MIHHCTRLTFVLLCILGLNCGSARPAVVASEPTAVQVDLGQAFIWRAENARLPGKVVYLLGSVHVGKEGIYPLDRSIIDAFNASATLAVEVNIEALDKLEFLRMLLSRATLPEGETLRDWLSPEAWDKLQAAAIELGISLEELLPYKPWFAAMNLLTLRTMAHGFDPQLGIDAHFIERASGRTEIVELETVTFQIDLFDGMSAQIQELLLLDALEGDIQIGGEIDELLDLWEAGDTAGFEEMLLGTVLSDSRFEPLFQRIVIDRNYTMTDSIIELARSRDAIFVVVGAGHFIGEKGIIALLESRGWTLVQLDKRGR